MHSDNNIWNGNNKPNVKEHTQSQNDPKLHAGSYYGN